MQVRRTLPRPARVISILLTVAGLILVLHYVFHFSLFGYYVTDPGYYYLLISAFLPLTFLFFTLRRQSSGMITIPDIVAAFLAFAIPIYFFVYSTQLTAEAWETGHTAPLAAKALSVVILLLVLEATRRVAGVAVAVVCLLFGVMPMFAEALPGPLQGITFSFVSTVCHHSMGTESILGIPMRVVGQLIVGFIVLAPALQVTGGGKFFIDFAMSLLGHVRGGPAKVSVMASAMFGTMSGSVVANVLGTGCVTIPTMKRAGYPPHFAGAVEAVASTGGVMMPPVMGATAFVMAEMLGVSYAAVMVAAVMPSVLYYTGLFVQIDAFAARTGLQGLSRKELPPLKRTLLDGWQYLLVLALLVYLIMRENLVAQAPFYCIALLLILAMTRKKTRLTWHSLLELFEGSGKVVADLVAILCGIGLIIGSLSMTGVAHGFSREIVSLAGSSVPLLFFLGALTCFVLGMGMPIIACYIFLALVLAPALTSYGYDPLAVHLFIMYWSMVSYITPPVALGSLAAAGLAGAPFMKTCIQAMRLGIVIYFIPFFFVLDPTFILHGAPLAIVQTQVTCIAGILLLGGGLEGWALGIGKTRGLAGAAVRVLASVSGILLALPYWQADVAGGLLGAFTYGVAFAARRASRAILTSQSVES